MFYRLNGPPEIDAVLMFSDSRNREECVCVCSRVFARRSSLCTCAFPLVFVCACVCDSNGLKWGIHTCKWSHLNLGPFSPLSQRAPYSLFRALLWHQPYGGKALWGSGLKCCTIDYEESSRFALYNLPSLEISTTNLQQAPCLIQTLDIPIAQLEH